MDKRDARREKGTEMQNMRGLALLLLVLKTEEKCHETRSRAASRRWEYPQLPISKTMEITVIQPRGTEIFQQYPNEQGNRLFYSTSRKELSLLTS